MPARFGLHMSYVRSASLALFCIGIWGHLGLSLQNPLDLLTDDRPGYRIDLVGIRTLVRVELQNVAGLALIADQLLSGEHDFLRRLIQPRVL